MAHSHSAKCPMCGADKDRERILVAALERMTTYEAREHYMQIAIEALQETGVWEKPSSSEVLGPNALDYSGSYILRRLRRDLIMGEVWVSGKFTKDAEAFPAQRGRVVLMAQKYYIYLVEGRWPYHTKVGRCRTWVQPDQPDKEFYERHDWILQNPPRPFGGGDFPHPEIADGIEPPE
jgi:hypothetical protein